MGHIESTRSLDANPEAVWKVISDPQTWEQWFTVHAGWLEAPPVTIEKGTKLVEKIVMLGMANKIEWTVTAAEENKRVTMAGTGMAGVKVEFTFALAATESGSELSIVGDFEGALIKGALGKAVEKDFTKQLDATTERLNSLAAV